ncbi:hypothetical protein B0H19DRAFT_1160736, partial [Mycena capillaripes]
MECLSKSRALYPDLPGFCFAALGDPKHEMHGAADTFRWAVIDLAYTVKMKDRAATVHALRRLADLHVILDDEDTALNLFHTALHGGTAMGIHRHRAECMVGIGDIMVRRGELIQAKEMWTSAHPLFVRSSRMKDATTVDERLKNLSDAQTNQADLLSAAQDTGSL